MMNYSVKSGRAAALAVGLAVLAAAPNAALAAPPHEASGNFVSGHKDKKAAAEKPAHKAAQSRKRGTARAAKRRAAPQAGALRQAYRPQPARASAVYFNSYAVQKPRPYEKAIHVMAQKYRVPEDLIHAVVNTESRYNYLTRGSVGEIGLMQIRPSTARLLGYTGSARGLYNPLVNLEYGTRYLALARYLSGGSLCGTVLKYNAGHGATRMNPVSFRYCQKVKAYLYAVGYR